MQPAVCLSFPLHPRHRASRPSLAGYVWNYQSAQERSGKVSEASKYITHNTYFTYSGDGVDLEHAPRMQETEA